MKYKCSECGGELSEEEVRNYLDNHEKLDFNWGQCNGEDARLVLIEEGKEK